MEQWRTTGGEEENRTHLDKTTHSPSYQHSHHVLTCPAHWVSVPLEWTNSAFWSRKFLQCWKPMNKKLHSEMFKDAFRDVWLYICTGRYAKKCWQNIWQNIGKTTVHLCMIRFNDKKLQRITYTALLYIFFNVDQFRPKYLNTSM